MPPPLFQLFRTKVSTSATRTSVRRPEALSVVFLSLTVMADPVLDHRPNGIPRVGQEVRVGEGG